MTKSLRFAACFAIAFLCGTPASAAVLVNFSFSGSAYYPGTVTGQLSFAQMGTNVAATSIKVLTSSNPNLPSFDSTTITNPSISRNSFNFSSAGDITSADFSYNFFSGSGTTSFFTLSNSNNGYSRSSPSGVSGTVNYDGFSGVRYTTLSAPVPEPATWIAMLFGFGLLGTNLRFRNQKVRIRFA